MLYQLASGRTIFISLDQYLRLDDEAFHQLVQGLEGDYISPDINFTHAQQDIEVEIDDSLDYIPDDDEMLITNDSVDLNDLPDF